jgi:glycosyltransferase involved in cell wall biosynthesis
MESFVLQGHEMEKAKISYSLTRRLSQSRIAAAYQDTLQQRYEFVGIQAAADIVIVHHPPRNYETVYALHPGLDKKYVISCCVSHASTIPAYWQRNLARVQEIWTCSEYCRQVYSRYHPKVTLIPYVVERDFGCPPEVLSMVKRLIGFEEDAVYFLSIATAGEVRKNVPMLVESFKRVASSMPRARLIVKALHSDEPSWTPHPQVVFLPFLMRFEYVSALYQIATAYVSAHHCEAWGLTMSDAMLYGKPVIGTGYSGNLEYMNSDNALLLSYRETDVPKDARDMEVDEGTWAEPDSESLEENFLRLYATHADPETLARVEKAREAVGRFTRPYVADFIYRSIDAALAS